MEVDELYLSTKKSIYNNNIMSLSANINDQDQEQSNKLTTYFIDSMNYRNIIIIICLEQSEINNTTDVVYRSQLAVIG